MPPAPAHSSWLSLRLLSEGALRHNAQSHLLKLLRIPMRTFIEKKSYFSQLGRTFILVEEHRSLSVYVGQSSLRNLPALFLKCREMCYQNVGTSRETSAYPRRKQSYFAELIQGCWLPRMSLPLVPCVTVLTLLLLKNRREGNRAEGRMRREGGNKSNHCFSPSHHHHWVQIWVQLFSHSQNPRQQLISSKGDRLKTPLRRASLFLLTKPLKTSEMLITLY